MTAKKPPMAEAVTVRTIGDRDKLVARKTARQSFAGKTWANLKTAEKDELLRLLAVAHGLVAE